ncbi:MAG: insulinase family protein [Myxococcales bacterium]|nr:insulinase family protein [Myxococcales bacterium]
MFLQWMIWGAAAAAPLDADDPFSGWHAEELPSGARIWIKPMAAEQDVRVTAWWSVGSIVEPAGLAGLSHLTEWLLRTTASEHTEAELRARIDGMGGSVGGSVERGLISSWVQVPSDEMDYALSRLVEQALTPRTLTVEQVVQGRRALAMHRRFDASRRASMVRWWESLTPEPPTWLQLDLGLPQSIVVATAPSPASLARVEPGDVERFQQRWLGPQNLTLTVVGGLRLEELRPVLKERLASLAPHGELADREPAPWSNRGVVRRFTFEERADALVRVRWRIPALDERDYVRALILRNALNNGAYDALRVRRKLAYGTRTRMTLALGHALISVSAEVPPARAIETRQVLVDLFEELRAGSMSEDAWIETRERAIQPLLLTNRHLNKLATMRAPGLPQVFPRFPPLAELGRSVQRQELAAWVEERVAPFGRTEHIVRPREVAAPLVRWSGWLVVGLSFAWLMRPGPSWSKTTGPRYLGSLRWMPAMLPWLAAGLVGVVLATAWCGHWLHEQARALDSHAAQALLSSLPGWALALIVVAGVSRVPRTVLLFEDELRIATLGASSWSWSWREVGEPRRGWALTGIAGAAAWPSPPFLFRRGVVLVLGRRRVLLSTSDDVELIEMIRRQRAAASDRSVGSGHDDV